MALTNFSLPFGALAQPVQPWGATIAPLHPVHQLATNTNNLLYSPAEHQQQDDGAPPPPGSSYYKNNPYAPPQRHQPTQSSFQYNNNNGRPKAGNTYLPPIQNAALRGSQQYHQQQQAQQQQQHQPFTHFNKQQQQQAQSQSQQQQQPQIPNNNLGYNIVPTGQSSPSAARTYGEGTYNRFPTATATTTVNDQQPQQQQQHQQYFKSFSATQTHSAATSSTTNTIASQFSAQQQQQQQHHQQQQQQQINTQSQLQVGQQNFGAKLDGPASIYGAAGGGVGGGGGGGGGGSDINGGGAGGGGSGAVEGSANFNSNSAYPERPPGFTRVQAGQGSRTQVHAVLDYDVEEGEEDYYDENENGEQGNKDGSKKSMPTVTPIQGPIFLKNNTVPVVPLFSYPTINNGSFVQIPIWWTALSVALGLDVRGDVIKGVPCIKRYHQLFCPTAGNRYPIDKIERFIDDNKALMRRMYGDFEMNMDPGGPRQQTKKRRRRFIDEPDIFIPPGMYAASIAETDEHDTAGPHAEEAGETYFGKLRQKRQSSNQNRGGGNKGPSNFGQNGPGSASNSGSTGRLDACESKVEIVTPYWASNSAGKIRAIVNTQHFEQAIHQEICSKAQTSRCESDCGCEQKYKWHRLLAYDPDNDCKGIFMDWFLFPSCCVCRCNP